MCVCVCVLLSVRLRVLGELAPRAHTHARTRALGVDGGREGEGIFNLGKRGVLLQTRSFSSVPDQDQASFRTDF